MIVMPFVMVTGFQNSNDEYTIKALFVYNFTKYIEWNQQNMQPQFKIGVMGESGIREKLATILKGKKLYNRTIEVTEVKSTDEITGYQILYITKDASDQLKQVLEHSAQSELLIITEDKNLATKGSCINIIEKDQKIRFEMNDGAIKKEGLKAANQLYDLAIVIH